MRHIGIVGNGDVVQKHHIPAIKELGYTYAICKHEDDFGAFLNQHFDAIAICTPNYLHVPMAIQALEAGHSVILEKPVGISTKQVEPLLNHPLVGRAVVCYQRHFTEEAQSIKKWVENPFGGKANVIVRRDPYYWNTWRKDVKQSGGGMLINIAIHTFDLLIWWLGDKYTVTFAKTAMRDGVDQAVYATIDFNGVPIQFFGSSLHEKRDISIELYQDNLNVLKYEEKTSNGHTEVYRRFLEKGEGVSVSEAVRSLALVEEIYAKS